MKGSILNFAIKLFVVALTFPVYLIGFMWKSIETWFKIGYEDNSNI